MSVEERMQRAAEQRLADVQEAFYALEEDPDNDEAADAVGMYCGCDTCTVREVLEAAVPLLLDAIRSGEYAP